MLIGYDHLRKCAQPLHADDHHRIAVIREYGIDPFVMVYRDAHSGRAIADQACRNFARWVNRRLYKVCKFDDYRATQAAA